MSRRVGHRFHPTDEEIINFFLKHKALGNDSEVEDDIAEVDICKCEPSELPMNKSDDDSVWFFFCPIDYKYRKSKSTRLNRKTRSGYWKPTGKDRKIWSKKGTKQQIGIKKTLVFYTGSSSKGIRTNWVIHEYHPTAPDFPRQRAYVICRLKRKGDETADSSTPDDGESSQHVLFDYGNISENTSPENNPQRLTNLVSLGNNDWFYNDSPSALQPQMLVELGQHLPSTNGFCIDVNGLQYVDDSEQENEDFLNNVIVDPFEETVNTHRNGSSPPKSLKKVYVEDSSDIDADSFHARDEEVMRTAQFGVLKGISSGTLPFSSRDSSDDSFTNLPEINCLDLDSEEIPIHKSQYQPKSHRIIAREQADFSREEVITVKVGKAAKHGNALDMRKKANSSVESNNLKSSWNQPSGTDRKGFFIFLDTPQLSHNSNPPSVYLVNALLGIFLLIVVVRELIIFGEWC